MIKQQWTGVSIITLAIIIGAAGYLVFSHQNVPIKFWFSDPTTFQECTLARGLILETYSEQCLFEGKSFTNTDQLLETRITNPNLYTNTTLGISFNNPIGWANPQQLPGNPYGDGGFRIQNQSLWKLNLGNPDQSSTCEGELCYNYTMEGFPAAEPATVLKKLQADPLIKVLSNETVNGYRVIIYDEGGICGYRNALAFGENATIAIVYRCGSGEDQGDLNSIIRSLKIN